MLAHHDVAVVHCPRSNGLLGCGVAPLAELRAAGLRVGIGTDGISSVPSHDAFEELRAAISAARARSERADALSPTEALELATLGGARALGLEADVGSLVPGKRADLAILTLAGSPYLPWEDPAAAVVYGGSPESASWLPSSTARNGMRGGFEWHELIDAAAAARRACWPAPPRQRSRSHRGHPLLHPDPQSREVGVRVPRPLVPHRVRDLQRRRLQGTAAASASCCGTAATGRAGTSPSLTHASRCRRPRRARRHSGTSRLRSRRTARPTRRSRHLTAYLALKPKDRRTRCASSPAFTSGRAASSPRRRRLPSSDQLSRRLAASSARRSTSARAPRSRPDPIDEGDRDPGQPEGRRGLR